MNIFLDANIQCVEQYIRPFLNDKQKFDANIIKSYEESVEDNKHFLPYVGNGKFGIALEADGAFGVMGKRALDVAIPYYPIVHVDWFDATNQCMHFFTTVAFSTPT